MTLDLVCNWRGGWPTTEHFRTLRPRTIRWIVYSLEEYKSAMRSIPPDLGIQTCPMFNGEMQEIGNDFAQWQSVVSQLRTLHDIGIQPTMIEAPANEWDAWSINTDIIARCAEWAYRTFAGTGVKIITGAVVSSDWVAKLGDLYNAIAPDVRSELGWGVHLYGKGWPGTMPQGWGDINDGWAVVQDVTKGGIPYLTEIGIKRSDAGGEVKQAIYLQGLHTFQRFYNAPMVAVFAYHDNVGTEQERGENGFGLIRDDGTPMRAFQTFTEINSVGKEDSMPDQSGVDNGYDIGPGVRQLLLTNSDKAATDEIYHNGRSHNGKSQYSETFGTSGNRYVYVFETNQVYIYRP